MGIIKKLSNLLSPGGGSGDPSFWITVKCNRCGEIIKTRINLHNDLSIDYNQDGGTVYYCRKTVMGEERCFQRIEVALTFDTNRRLIGQEITGGQFVDE